jgi:hypothetical protein
VTVSAQVVTQSARDDVPTSRLRGLSATTLDALAVLGSAPLESMFAEAAPVTLAELQGHPRGRALARPHITAPWLVGVLRSAHASSLFPWEGKSFRARAGDKEGVGINRVRLGVHTGLFPFRTREAVSVVDGGPCVAIDYDVPANPAVARPIYDEVRRIHLGLYLGRGMSRRPGREPKLLLWFALDTRIQDRPVAFRDVR